VGKQRNPHGIGHAGFLLSAAAKAQDKLLVLSQM